MSITGKQFIQGSNRHQTYFTSLEAQLVLKIWQPDLTQKVRNVKGIGKRATAILIVFTQAFEYTQTYQQQGLILKNTAVEKASSAEQGLVKLAANN